MNTPSALLERYAIQALGTRLAAIPDQAPQDPLHILSHQESSALAALSREVMMTSALTGALSTGLPALFEINGASELFVIALVVLLASLELLYLYWMQLRAAASLLAITGIHRLKNEPLIASMARGALELSDPPLTGSIDPHRESPRWRQTAGKALYTLKFTLSSFLFKLLIRRLTARSLFRILAPLLASVPLMIFWNVLTSYLIMRELRLRAVGSALVEEVMGSFFDEHASISVQAQGCLRRAVAVAIVKKRAAHPTLVALLQTLAQRWGDPPLDEIDSAYRLLHELPLLSSYERGLTLLLLQVAFVLDGHLSRRERSFLLRAKAACQQEQDLSATDDLLSRVLRGQEISQAVLANLGGPPKVAQE